jgi:hypothetical protein
MRVPPLARSPVLLALALALASAPPARAVSTADMRKCHAELGFTMPVSEILNCGVDMRHYVECLDATHCKSGTPEYNDALLEFRRVCCQGDTTCGHERFNELCGSRDFGSESPWWRIALITVVSCLGAVLLCLCCYCGVSGAWRDLLWHGNSAFVSCSNWCAACWGWGPPYATQRQPLMRPGPPAGYAYAAPPAYPAHPGQWFPSLMRPGPPPGHAYAAPPANPALPGQWFPSLAAAPSASLVYGGAPGQPMPYPQRAPAPAPAYAQPPPPPPPPPQQYVPPAQVAAPPQINAQAVYLGQPPPPQPPQPPAQYPQSSAQTQIFMPR